MLALAPHDPLASAEEIAAVWPGGARNPLRGYDGWIECYAQLTAFGERDSMREDARANAKARVAEIVARAAAREPVPVELSIGLKAVYPKSAPTLALLDAIDALVVPAAQEVAELQQELAHHAGAGSEAEALAMRVWSAVARSLALRTWAWILLSPGVGTPFGDTGNIEPPSWTADLTAADVLAIYLAHRSLHHDDVHAMVLAMPRDDGGERSALGFGGFGIGLAMELKVEPHRVARRWSIPEQVAAGLTMHEQQRVAEANAKRKRTSGANT